MEEIIPTRSAKKQPRSERLQILPFADAPSIGELKLNNLTKAKY